MAGINWLAVVAAAVATFVLGGLWYGPLFGKAWMAASGMTDEMSKRGNMAKIFGLSFVLELIASVVLAMFIGGEATLGFAAAAGFAVGAGWIATGLGVLYLFERRPLAHWAVNAGYHTVAFTLMGLIIGVARRSLPGDLALRRAAPKQLSRFLDDDPQSEIAGLPAALERGEAKTKRAALWVARKGRMRA